MASNLRPAVASVFTLSLNQRHDMPTVPEPGSLILMGFGLAILLLVPATAPTVWPTRAAGGHRILSHGAHALGPSGQFATKENRR